MDYEVSQLRCKSVKIAENQFDFPFCYDDTLAESVMPVLLRLSWGLETIFTSRNIVLLRKWNIHSMKRVGNTSVRLLRVCQNILWKVHNYLQITVGLWRILEFRKQHLTVICCILFTLRVKTLSELMPMWIRNTVCGTPTAAWKVYPRWRWLKCNDGTHYSSSIVKTSKKLVMIIVCKLLLSV